MFTDPAQRQEFYDPKRLKMLWALMNNQRQAPQPKLMGHKPQGQGGNLEALAKGMPNNMTGRSLRPPRIGGFNANQNL